jgi:hypothetical protein
VTGSLTFHRLINLLVTLVWRSINHQTMVRIAHLVVVCFLIARAT